MEKLDKNHWIGYGLGVALLLALVALTRGAWGP